MRRGGSPLSLLADDVLMAGIVLRLCGIGLLHGELDPVCLS